MELGVFDEHMMFPWNAEIRKMHIFCSTTVPGTRYHGTSEYPGSEYIEIVY